MSDIGKILAIAMAFYAVGMSLFMISDNRRPQATLAWILAFILAPVAGALVYLFFGRETKAFSKQSSLLRQELSESAQPILAPMLARQNEEIKRLENTSANLKKLLMLVRHNSNSLLTTHNEVELLQDAIQFYPRLAADMKAARHSIHLQYFIWGADEFTERLKEIMIAKAQEGVQVRLLFDPVGSHAHLSRRYIRDLQDAGVLVAPTSPLYRLHTISYRNHRKITVIDSAIGYTGGMNIGKEHLDGGKGFTSWRDTQIRIAGEGSAALQVVFMVDWYNATRENLFAQESFRRAPLPPQDRGVPVQILTSGPDSEWAAIRQLYFFMIVNAQRQILMQSPYFVLDATIAEALSSAALAGVDVRVMLSARASGNRLPAWAGNTYIADVVRAGVRVFLYDKGYLHAKTISVDSTICSIGSANIDIRSFSINYELNAVLYSEQYAQQLEHDFEHDLASCTEFSIEEYERSNVLLRFRDSVARIFSPLL
jgi:cardiolipin synthase A/B